MDTTPVCKECGATLAADAPEGLCGACLMKVALGTQPGSNATPGASSPGELPDPAKLAELFPQLQILELLGRGGMGAVYKARQPGLDRFVALKILPPATGNDAGFAERFNREARALAKLNHPNIVAVYDFGQAQGLNYFLMEFVDGANLRQVQRANKLSTSEALQIVPQICAALQFAHDEGVVHRDIKPENVLLDKKGRVKIADFGLAKILGLEPRDLKLTGVRDVMGTPHYMAPEQVERPQEVDHRADIYSLGVVFYELLTGELPLGKFSPPSERVQVDVRLDEVVLHTLEKEPSRRYQHVSEVKTDVENIARTEGGGRRPDKVPPVMPASPHADAWDRVRPPALGLILAGLLNWAVLPLLLLALWFVGVASPAPRWPLMVPIAAFVFGGVMLSAGLRMKRLELRGFALFGSVLAMLIPPGNLVGLPIGIWALAVLGQREIREAFAARARGGLPDAPRQPVNNTWKIVAVIATIILMLLAIPVIAILLSIAIPASQRTRAAQQRRATQIAQAEAARRAGIPLPLPGYAPGTPPVGNQSQSPSLLTAWLAQADIDLAKIDPHATPNVQVVIEDLQSDGTSRFRNVIQEVVEGPEPQKQIQFANSDIVELRHTYDEKGNILPFSSIHQDGRFLTSIPLREPIGPGGILTYAADGIMRNKVDEDSRPGIYTYRFTHSPNASVHTRRIEVHQLPTGAELLDLSENAKRRERNGRTEVVLDKIIPPGDNVTLYYRYRLPDKSPAPEAP